MSEVVPLPRSTPDDEEPDPIAKAVARGVKQRRKLQLEKRRSVVHAPEANVPDIESTEGLEELEALLNDPLAKAWLNEGSMSRVDVGKARKEGRVAPMPRRKKVGGKSESSGAPPMARHVDFDASVFAALARLFIWVWGLTRYFGGILIDKLLFRDDISRRAVRLRRTLESLGPTFIKLGQQLSVRADVLPYEYCAELSKMLDSIAPFDSKLAIAEIERTTGRKVTDIFAIFDPEPIGSASLACVYQAMLHNGERVAVKVRRPRIGKRLAADLRALDWLMAYAELVALVRPGLTRNLSIELVAMLMEELDFGREARYTDIFRRRAKEKGQDYVTAPRIYRELSSESVMVSEFVGGVFLWEILNALDRGDEETLEQIRAKDIEPKEIAIAMAELYNWESMESLLFHADPHPANIICKPGNQIVLIDFGSCGRFSSKTRRLFHQLHHYMNNEDVQGMVECSISMLEPLPPIDLDRFTKEVEGLYWELMYASKDGHAEWWEKASGVLWIRFAGLARRYNIPMNLDTMRLFRATFLYDTVMFRLWKDLDLDVEYQRYFEKLGRRAKKRVSKAWNKRVQKGLTNKDYMQVEEMLRMGNQIIARLQHILDTPQHNFASVIGKAAYGVSMGLKALILGFTVHLIAVLGVSVYAKVMDHSISMAEAFTRLVGSPAYQAGVLVVGLIVIRKALMRFEDIDVRKS